MFYDVVLSNLEILFIQFRDIIDRYIDIGRIF